MKRVAAVVLLLALIGGGAWFLLQRRSTPPVSIPASALSTWTVVTSDGTDPWIVGARPPDALTASLREQVSRQTRQHLVQPPHPAVPLVLQSEFADSLQGVYGTDSVVRIAREAGIESETFEPVCLARQTVDAPSGAFDVYFVPFDAPAFYQMRADLTPLEPEHAGIGIYDPALLTPALVVGATGEGFASLWPIRFDRNRDCAAEIVVGRQ